MTMLVDVGNCKQCGKPIPPKSRPTITFNRQRIRDGQIELRAADHNEICEECTGRVMRAARKLFK